MKKLMLGAAIVMAGLGAGGVAYAASNDPAPEQGYVTVEDEATTPSPAPRTQDCPEKNGASTQPSDPAGDA